MFITRLIPNYYIFLHSINCRVANTCTTTAIIPIAHFASAVKLRAGKSSSKTLSSTQAEAAKTANSNKASGNDSAHGHIDDKQALEKQLNTKTRHDQRQVIEKSRLRICGTRKDESVSPADVSSPLETRRQRALHFGEVRRAARAAPIDRLRLGWEPCWFAIAAHF